MTRYPKLQKSPRNVAYAEKARGQHDNPTFGAGANTNILLRKNYEALGSFRSEDRPRALDQLGFTSQLVFTTWCLGNFGLDESGHVDLSYAVAEAHNRMMTGFCAIDRRLLGTAYVPLVDFDRAVSTATNAIGIGCRR